MAGRNEENGQKIVDQIKQGGGTAIFVQMDVSDAESVRQSVQQTAKELGDIEILFNGAGIPIIMMIYWKRAKMNSIRSSLLI